MKKMPASPSKITFDAINFVKAENIYLTESKKDRNVKRKNTTTDEVVSNQKKKLAQDLDVKSLNHKPSTKHKKSVNPSNEMKLKSASSVGRVAAAKKTRKRQNDIGNAYSKLNSQVKNQLNPSKSPKTVLGEKTESRSSLYLTPRQDAPFSEIDFENINPNSLPENFYECELDEFIRSQYPDFEDSEEYDFQEPLNFANFDLPQENFYPKDSCLIHFKELLNQEESLKSKLLEKSEMEMLKDIVKADDRYQKLRKDDSYLLKDILMGHLREISEQERIIKIALENIRSRRHHEYAVDNLKVKEPEKELEQNFTIPNSDSMKTKTDKGNTVSNQEVDVFFKNVPSLDKEIRILKLLAHKLEEILKESDKEKTPKKPKNLLTTQSVGFRHLIGIASSSVLPFLTKFVTGLAQEFKISHQTINELKLERDFYIATDLDNFTLQRTNFNYLRHNPELLLRRLKPLTKDSRLKFNFIEQDPMFFNHFLAKICKISSDSLNANETFIPKISKNSIVLNQKTNKMFPALSMSGAGDHSDIIFKEEEEEEEAKPKVEVEEAMVDKPSRTFVGRKRSKYRRTSIEDTNQIISAKNSLIKRTILGFLHLTIALVVLSAILYPDVFCV